MLLRVFPVGAHAFHEGIASLNLTMSVKSTIVVSDPGTRARLHARLNDFVITAKWCKVARDLGLDNTAGKRRSTATHQSHLRKVRAKLVKIKQMGRARRRLYRKCRAPP